jgi:hypothetical protein
MEKPGAGPVGQRSSQGKPGGELEGSKAEPQGRKWLIPGCQEKRLSEEVLVPVPQTDTGRQVEDTKAIERTLVKEFGKMGP